MAVVPPEEAQPEEVSWRDLVHLAPADVREVDGVGHLRAFFSASAADPSNIMGQFLASLLTLEDAIPTQAEVLDLINAKVTAYFADAEKLKEVADLMAEKEAVVGAGRRPDGSLMWRKPRAAKAEAEAPTEEKPGEISA